MPLYTVPTAAVPQYMALADKIVSNTVAETSCLSGTSIGSSTIAAGRLQPGTTIQISGGGVYTIPVVTPGGATVKVKLGGAVVATALVASLVGGVTNAAFQFDCALVCRSIGALGKVAAIGGLNFATTANSRVFSDLMNAATDATVDTTQSLVLDVTFAWEFASATRTITVRGAIATLLN